MYLTCSNLQPPMDAPHTTYRYLLFRGERNHSSIMNRKTFLLIGLTALGLSMATPLSQARADEIRKSGNFGLGLGVSTFAAPLSAKYFMADSHALQFNAGFFQDDLDFEGQGVGLGLDYLFEMPAITSGGGVELGWAAGLGPAFGTAHGHSALAAVGVLGLEFNIKAISVDFVLEYRPQLLLTPDVDLDLVEFGGHARYYF
ncbi:MAG: hypothetical protein BWY17_03181 [Deltaproteobacteria bacterium ADurb.Bin207]|nr:MAG: hypothetical protein BWY17_03181 [Deltaproteobacteria bacterium ADurb.Bin207]